MADEKIAEILDRLEPNDIIDYFGYGNLLDNVPDEMLISVLQKRGYTVELHEYPTPTVPSKESFEKLLPEGWKVTAYPRDDEPNACEWYHGSDGCTVVQVEKDDIVFSAMPEGDIRIYGASDDEYFIHKGSRTEGELTEKLIHEGKWDNNNWFHIDQWNRKKMMEERAKLKKKEQLPDFHTYGREWDDVCFNISDIVEVFVEFTRKVEKGEPPF